MPPENIRKRFFAKSPFTIQMLIAYYLLLISRTLRSFNLRNFLVEDITQTILTEALVICFYNRAIRGCRNFFEGVPK